MKLVLSHDTALEYLRSTSAERSSRPQASRSLVAGCCANYEQALRLGKSLRAIASRTPARRPAGEAPEHWLGRIPHAQRPAAARLVLARRH